VKIEHVAGAATRSQHDKDQCDGRLATAGLEQLASDQNQDEFERLATHLHLAPTGFDVSETPANFTSQLLPLLTCSPILTLHYLTMRP
jgi:hypothetical protein